MANFTFRELNFNINDTNDQSIMNIMCPIGEVERAPKESTIRNILGYSKALSVRKSKHLHSIQMLLN